MQFTAYSNSRTVSLICPTCSLLQAPDRVISASRLFILKDWFTGIQDHVARALSTSDGEQHSYSSLLCHAANKLSKAVTGEHLITSFQEPRKYTGRYITNYKEFQLFIF